MLYLDNVKQALRDVWAKSSDSSDQPGLSLFQHTENVVKQMGQFVMLYQNQLKQITEVDMTRILMYGALMHDFGKIHRGFQEVVQRKTKEKFGHRHEVLSLAFINFLEVPSVEKSYLATAIGLHHKNWLDIAGGKIKGNPSYYIPNLPVEEIVTIKELIEGAKADHIQGVCLLMQNAEKFFADTAGIRVSPYPFRNGSFSAESIYKNLSAINDLVSTFVTETEFTRKINPRVCYQATVVRGLMLSADHLASAETMELDKGFTSPKQALEALGRSYDSLYTHQQAMAKSPGGKILIAPTGSGKTEAALLWAGSVRQAQNTGGRLYFLLPFQASINAMVDRLKKDFGDSSAVAIHGKTLVQGYQELMEQGYGPEEAQKMSRHKESLARLNTAPMRVCTPYQLLRAFFATKGYEAILCTVLGAQLVFDEIHAYDAEMAGMTLSAAKFMKEMMGAECLFMSATMPTYLREILEDKFSLKNPVVLSNKWLEEKARHKLSIVKQSIMEHSSIQKIMDAVKQGSVLVVVNTVAKAIAMARELEKIGLPEIVLLHSRFCAKDRADKEGNLTPKKGKVLVATQVVEVSLDIDYDTLFTELAPLESLLQRCGRVNRKGDKGQVSVVHVFTQFAGEGKKSCAPYDSEHLFKVNEVLNDFIKENPTGIISEVQIQKLLDDSYPDELRQVLSRQIKDKLNKFYTDFIKQLLPLGVQELSTLNHLREKWDDLFDGEEVLPLMYLDDALVAPNPLEVAKYMVPVSRGQFARMKREKKASWDDTINKYVTNCHYTYEYGLIVE